MNIFQKLALALRTCDPQNAPENWSLRFINRFWLWRFLQCECCKFWRAFGFGIWIGSAVPMLATLMWSHTLIKLWLTVWLIITVLILAPATGEAWKARKS